MRNFTIYTLHQVLYVDHTRDRAYRKQRKNEIYVIFYSENLKGRDNSGDLDVDGRIVLKPW
jgi:hypothetical protein